MDDDGRTELDGDAFAGPERAASFNENIGGYDQQKQQAIDALREAKIGFVYVFEPGEEGEGDGTYYSFADAPPVITLAAVWGAKLAAEQEFEAALGALRRLEGTEAGPE